MPTEPREQKTRIVGAMPWREVRAHPQSEAFKGVNTKVAAFKRATAVPPKRAKK